MSKATVNPILSEEQIIQKLETYCAYQERCLAEVKKKMKQLGVESSEELAFITYLQENKFIDEKRFIEKFTQGKLNIKKWGKFKIKYQLESKQINKIQIEQELNQIDANIYEQTLIAVLQKKNRLLKEEDDFKRRQKLIAYTQQKGFELELILKTLKKINL
ncbi:MAG TPA: regulatory protein RecX [Chitinophagales bacterium]|nr:regulatory protein RecX [Chitinophagales bacterium]